MKEELLEKIGLTKGETKVYTALIKLGSTTAGAVIKETGLQRSAVYFCLDSLVKKGLVGYVIKNDRKHFEANKPESLLDFLNGQKKEIESHEKELKNFIPLLFARRMSTEEKEAKVYEGWRGVLNAFFDVLEPLGAGERGCAFSPTADYGGADPERVRNLIKKVRMKRASKKIKLRMLMCENLRGTLGKDFEETPYTEVRYIPKEDLNPAVVNIYGISVLIVLWTETPVAFMIRSSGVAESFNNYFKLLWTQAKHPKISF